MLTKQDLCDAIRKNHERDVWQEQEMIFIHPDTPHEWPDDFYEITSEWGTVYIAQYTRCPIGGIWAIEFKDGHVYNRLDAL
jgi:hypothetical protein